MCVRVRVHACVCVRVRVDACVCTNKYFTYTQYVNLSVTVETLAFSVPIQEHIDDIH